MPPVNVFDRVFDTLPSAKLNVCREDFAGASPWKNAGSVLAAIKHALRKKKGARVRRRGLKNPLCPMSFRARLKRGREPTVSKWMASRILLHGVAGVEAHFLVNRQPGVNVNLALGSSVRRRFADR